MRSDGSRSRSLPKRVGWFGYWLRTYSSSAHCDFSWRLSTWVASDSPHASDEKRTMALRQLYSAESTCRALSFSTCSWKIRIWSIKATTLSAAMGDAWIPAAASRGATWRGMELWAAFNTNSSLQLSRRRATWSVTCKSGKNGIFLAHSTAEKSRRAASSQMFSMPMMLLGCMHCPYREVGYGSALNSIEMKLERYVCPFRGSPLNI